MPQTDKPEAEFDERRERQQRIHLRLGERVATILRLDVACCWQAINVNAASIAELDESIDAAIAAAKAFGLDNLAGGRIIRRTPDDEVC